MGSPEDVSVRAPVRARVYVCVRVRMRACWRDVVIELWLKWQVNSAPFSCRRASPRLLRDGEEGA